MKVIFNKDMNVNVAEMKGNFGGFLRVKYKKVRIIFVIDDNDNIYIITIERIGFRKDVYR